MFDSIRSSITKKPNFYGDFNTRNSFISNYRAQIKGVFAGVSYNKQFTIALGYNWLDTDFESVINDNDKVGLKLRYISPFVQYSFLEKNNFIVSVPIYLGFGQSLYETEDKKQFKKNLVILYEPAMKVTYRFLRYLNVSAGIGFRVVLIGNNKISENFNSPTYTIGVGMFFGEAYSEGKKQWSKIMD
ncbi:hypothetical protein N9P38_00950 [Flavobacteriales bacterium]|nr:hypothetical protein [Flavobacteriales bacterium]MDB4088903.1 hypothetical protein [Flavobacteriales bacterium]